MKRREERVEGLEGVISEGENRERVGKERDEMKRIKRRGRGKDNRQRKRTEE